MSNLTKEKVDELYANLLIDPNFEKLELLRNQPNIFEVLKLQHYEIRHSNFLGWLLDPNGNHGIGDYFLRRFLIKILQDPRANHPDYIDQGVYNVIDIHQLLDQFISVHREQDYIDILIEFEKAVIVIENKIHATEGNDQLARYKKFIEENYPKKKPIFVYLTKYGVEASINDYFIEMSYQDDILNYLNDLIQYKSDSIHEQVLFYIKDYINNLNINVMQQSDANKIAEKLYLQHQALFDFIINNRPDDVDKFGKILSSFLISKGFIIGSNQKGYVRFLSPKLADLFCNIKTECKGWKNNELFLFEIFFNKRNTFYFKATTAPSSSPLKEVINHLLVELPDSNRINHNDWTTFINENIKRERIQTIIKLDEFELNNTLEQLMKPILPHIEEIENKLIENQTLITNSITLEQS